MSTHKHRHFRRQLSLLSLLSICLLGCGDAWEQNAKAEPEKDAPNPAIAFLASGAEFFASLEKNAPSIAEVSAIAPQITGQTGKRNVAVMNLVIPRSTQNQAGAIKFAEFVTNNDNQLAFAKAANVLPSTQAAVDQYRQELENLTNPTPLEQARRVSAQQLETAEVLIPPMANLNQLKRIIYESLGAAMLGRQTVEEALTEAEQLWNQNLKG